MPKSVKRGSRKRKQAEERKKLMAEVAERDKKRGVEPKPKKVSIAVVAEEEHGSTRFGPIRRKGGAPERGAGPTGPRASRAFAPVMGKPKKRDEMSLWERWFESHGDRFDSWDAAREHFREKVCEHKNLRHLSTQNRPGGMRVLIYRCEGCGKMTKGQSPPSGH
jgi:hypothetical protein